MLQMQDLAVIILNYRSKNDVVRQLNTLIGEGIDESVFYILDNDTDHHKELENFCKSMGVYFHQMNSNRGYAYANNWAIRKGLLEGKNFFLILNPDIHISYDTIQRLYSCLHNRPEVGILGPRIKYRINNQLIFSDGGLLFPEKGFLGDHVNSHKMSTETTDLTGLNYDIDYVNGSAMMFRREVLDEIGFMAEHLFMYYEESEWCYRLKLSKKWKLAIDTSLSVYQTDSSRGEIYEYYMTRNRVWFCRKWNGNLKMLLKERFKTIKRIFRQKELTRRQKRQFAVKILSGIAHGFSMKL